MKKVVGIILCIILLIFMYLYSNSKKYKKDSFASYNKWARRRESNAPTAIKKYIPKERVQAVQRIIESSGTDY